MSSIYGSYIVIFFEIMLYETLGQFFLKISLHLQQISATGNKPVV